MAREPTIRRTDHSRQQKIYPKRCIPKRDANTYARSTSQPGDRQWLVQPFQYRIAPAAEREITAWCDTAAPQKQRHTSLILRASATGVRKRRQGGVPDTFARAANSKGQLTIIAAGPPGPVAIVIKTRTAYWGEACSRNALLPDIPCDYEWANGDESAAYFRGRSAVDRSAPVTHRKPGAHRPCDYGLRGPGQSAIRWHSVRLNTRRHSMTPWDSVGLIKSQHDARNVRAALIRCTRNRWPPGSPAGTAHPGSSLERIGFFALPIAGRRRFPLGPRRRSADAPTPTHGGGEAGAMALSGHQRRGADRSGPRRHGVAGNQQPPRLSG